ncbi:MAG: hypothetical protein SFV19_16195 [Rhodospirillaceae bacterium]|nr:hypothetical protein [Rhodospirillaceae bacterium]
MKSRAHRVFTWLIVALSVVHIAATPAIFSELKSSLAWFVGVGLMGLFLAFLNFIAARHSGDRAITRFCLAANVLGALFAGGNIITDPAPQSYVAALLFIGLALSAPRPSRNASVT